MDDELAAARAAGHAAAEASLEQAPTEPLLRVAWMKGHGQVTQLAEAVHGARESGATWPQIAAALDEHPRTARTKFGGGIEAMRRYRERKREGG